MSYQGNSATTQLRRRRREWLASIKINKGCEVCGYNKSAVALQFDHINPEDKVAGVAQLVSEGKTMKTILAELPKCRILCSNCHAEHTHKDSIDLGKDYKESEQLDMFSKL